MLSRTGNDQPISLLERDFEVIVAEGHQVLMSLQKACARQVGTDVFPVRFVVTSTSLSKYHCEVGSIRGIGESVLAQIDSIFEFRRRPIDNEQQFNVVLAVPTGIGAEIGGHAGDAAPLARLLGAT